MTASLRAALSDSDAENEISAQNKIRVADKAAKPKRNEPRRAEQKEAQPRSGRSGRSGGADKDDDDRLIADDVEGMYVYSSKKKQTTG